MSYHLLDDLPTGEIDSAQSPITSSPDPSPKHGMLSLLDKLDEIGHALERARASAGSTSRRVAALWCRSADWICDTVEVVYCADRRPLIKEINQQEVWYFAIGSLTLCSCEPESTGCVAR